MWQALAIAGKAAAAGGQLYAGFSEAKSLTAQSRVKKRQAGEVRVQTVWDQIRLEEDARRTLATQRQLLGEAGVRMTGTAVDVLAETKTEFVLDKMMLARNAELEYQGLMSDARELKKAASRAKTSGVINAFSSFF
jgi:hypothetical protein